MFQAGIQWKGANEKSFDITYKDVQSSAKSSKSSDGTEGEEFLLMVLRHLSFHVRFSWVKIIFEICCRLLVFPLMFWEGLQMMF